MVTVSNALGLSDMHTFDRTLTVSWPGFEQWFIQTPRGGYNPPVFMQHPNHLKFKGDYQGVFTGGGCLCDRDGMGNKRGQILTWINLFTLWNNVRKIFGTTTYAHKVWHSEVTEFGSVTHVGEGACFSRASQPKGRDPSAPYTYCYILEWRMGTYQYIRSMTLNCAVSVIFVLDSESQT